MKKIFKKNLNFVTIFSIIFLSMIFVGANNSFAQNDKAATDPASKQTTQTTNPTPPTNPNGDGGGVVNKNGDGGGVPTETKSGLQITLTNPLKSNTLEDFVQVVLGVILKFLIPILAILFMYTGFKLVMARGEPKALQAAKQDFLNLVIGAVLILGAWTFGNIIMNTLKEVGILN